MAKVKQILALIDDYPSLVSTEMQLQGIETTLTLASEETIDICMLKFDEIEDPTDLYKLLHEKPVTNLVCYRLSTLRSLVATFWDLCNFISELKAIGIEFTCVKEGISSEDGLNQFLKHLTQGWKTSRSLYKSENAKVSQMKARASGIPLGRPKKRDDLIISSLRQQGLSIRDIAARTGVSTAAVQRSIKAAKSP